MWVTHEQDRAVKLANYSGLGLGLPGLAEGAIAPRHRQPTHRQDHQGGSLGNLLGGPRPTII